MTLPSKITIGQVWRPIRRDRSRCIAFLRTDVETNKADAWYLSPGVYNGGFLKVTDVTHKVPDGHLIRAFANQSISLTAQQIREQYIVIRRYETTTG